MSEGKGKGKMEKEIIDEYLLGPELLAIRIPTSPDLSAHIIH